MQVVSFAAYPDAEPVKREADPMVSEFLCNEAIILVSLIFLLNLGSFFRRVPRFRACQA